MSVHVLSWVFQNSEAEAGERLVLLVLANFADEGGLSWPSLSRIARESKLSVRQVRRCLRKLETDGCLVTTLNAAPDQRQPDNRKTNAYRILWEDTRDRPTGLGGTSATLRGDIRGGAGGTPMSAKPSLNRYEPRQVPRSLASPTGERPLCDEAQAALDADLAALDAAMQKKRNG